MERKKDVYTIKSNIEKLENSIVSIEITIDKANINNEFNKAFNEFNKTAKLPGFRPGKVPEAIIRKKYLPNVKYIVLNEIVPNAYKQALDNNGLIAITEPDFGDIEDVKENEDFTFKLKVEVPPTVTIGKYKGHSLKRNIYSFEKSDVDKHLKKLARKQSTFQPKDTPIEHNDLSLIEYEYFITGERPGKPTSSIIEFNEEEKLFSHVYKELIGLKKEEEKIINTKIPDDYFDKEMAGKKGSLWVKVITINSVITPKIDDEFAKDLNYESLEKLTNDVHDKLKKECEHLERDELAEEIVGKIVEESIFDIPKSLIDKEMINSIMRFEYHLNRTGMKFEEYLAFEKITRDEFIEKQREDALKNIKRNLIIFEIIKLEDIKVNDEDVDNYLKKYLNDEETSITKLKADYEKPENKEKIDNEILVDKLIDLLIENSKIGKGEKKKLEI